MDIAYFQLGADNLLRPVCPHDNTNHCVGPPDTLDVWRSALFLAYLHHSPQLRIIGVDGQVGPLIDDAIETLCARGFVDGPACGSNSITYEVRNQGRGWYYFHHHHFHVSLLTRRQVSERDRHDVCLRPDCGPVDHDE